MPAIRANNTAAARAPRKKATGPSEPCPVCNKRVGRQSDLKRHMDQHASHEAKKFRCPHCPYRTNILGAYKAHADKHDGILYPCPAEDCDRQFSDKATRSRHFSKFHKADDTKKKACTPQDVNTVRKSRVPAVVRRETQDIETLNSFSQFASGVQSSALNVPEEQSHFFSPSTEFDSPPSTPTSLSSETPLNLGVADLLGDQSTWSSPRGDEVKFDHAAQDLHTQWRVDPHCEFPTQFFDIEYDIFPPSYLPSSLQDFSFSSTQYDAPYIHGENAFNSFDFLDFVNP